MLTVTGAAAISDRLDAALRSERRIERYSLLSTQVTGFLVIAVEAFQSGVDAELRDYRMGILSDQIEETFGRIRADLADAVEEAVDLGLDEQSRRATLSLNVARMEALLNRSLVELEGAQAPEAVQGAVNEFLRAFDPMLNGAIAQERRTRDQILASISSTRTAQSRAALGVGAVTLLLLAGVWLGLIRPAMRRLDLLRQASREIARENFAVALPETGRDEIGQVFAETNRMASALAARKAAVDADWARLNSIIDERTAELQAANAALERTDRDRRRFFADVSHELRTPLTVIRMEAELGEAQPEDAGDSLKVIHNRAVRLSRRIDDLLRVARSETGEIALEAGRVDLGDVASDAVAECAAELSAAGIVARVEGGEVPDVTGDANWLRQVVTGLLQNTCRHAAGTAEAVLRVRADGGRVRLDVIDRGPGIADVSAVFERFAQGEGVGRSAGFGIGLSLAKWVVERQGGTIAITSPLEDGTGTMVSLVFPRAGDSVRA
ncbi:HAMP domain-containing protein [Algicella marina]|uniref:histidine kinase n=2 Tax=Algicella marina TaxID=2683284 RepID=A0A6P1T699_9RHOB|nr:HAMP domain-containing protein [Algicella marina]